MEFQCPEGCSLNAETGRTFEDKSMISSKKLLIPMVNKLEQPGIERRSPVSQAPPSFNPLDPTPLTKLG